MPTQFPVRDLTLSDFYNDALERLSFAEPVVIDGGLPDIKKQFDCKIHGAVSLIYNPKYAKLTDRMKDVPCVSYTLISACRECVATEQQSLFDAHQDELAQKAKDKKEREMLAKIESYGVALRNINHDIRDIKARNEAQQQAIDKALSIGKAITEGGNAGNLILCGSVGTGKTLISGSLVSALVRDGHYAKIRTVSNIVRTLKGAWRRDCEYTEQQVIDDMVSLDLLVIDEIGVQFGSDTEKMFIFEIIDGRYNKMKPTILISNLAVDGIKELIGERCIDRLREDGGKVIAFDYESQRGKK